MQQKSTILNLNKYLQAIALGWFLTLLVACGGPADDAQQTTASDATAFKLHFAEVTESAGLADFEHITGAAGDKWFPEAMGSGCAIIDYNNDNWQDILLVGGGHWPKFGDNSAAGIWLYHNNGDGTFSQMTSEAGLGDVRTYGYGLAVADYDNDGDEDFLLTTLWENMLFRNDNGVFSDVSISSGVQGDKVWSTSAIFFDADKDGWLDLYVGNYVDWSPENDLMCTLDGETKSYCTPELYTGIPSRFYRNNGDGTFSDKTESAGFLPAPGKTLGIVEFDFNRDGWPDLAVANDTQRDLLYKNNGDGTFEEIGAFSGIGYDENGRARAGMGIDAGIVDPGGKETIFVGNFSKEMIGVYRYLDNGLFNDRAAASKIGRPSLLTLTFGLFLFDVDLDGDLDLYAANGHVQEEIEVTQDGITYREPPHLFINDGNGKFIDKQKEAGEALRLPVVGRGAVYCDFDRDGDLDILTTENGGPAHLLRNDSEHQNQYLRVKLVGRKSNRSACGSRVVAYAEGMMQERRVRTGSSFLSSAEKTVTFGLGSQAAADSLIVYWPSGIVEKFTNISANQVFTVTENSDGHSTH